MGYTSRDVLKMISDHRFVGKANFSPESVDT